jgi:hypothetical protein
MINKIKKLKKVIKFHFLTTEDERLRFAEMVAYNKAIDDVCKLFSEEDEMRKVHNSIKEVKIVSELEYSEGAIVQSDCDNSSKKNLSLTKKLFGTVIMVMKLVIF